MSTSPPSAGDVITEQSAPPQSSSKPDPPAAPAAPAAPAPSQVATAGKIPGVPVLHFNQKV